MGFSPSAALAEVREFKFARAKETRNTCPYCAVEAKEPGHSTEADTRIDAASAPFIMAALQTHWVRKVGSCS
jgi:hypothetical protein